jgi:carbamoyltransferase
MNIILGISAFYHDSSAALVVDGKIVAAAQEERFNREKNSKVFPELSIRYCLDEYGINIDDIDSIIYYEKPLLKFERILESIYNYSPRGLKLFLNAMPEWIGGKLFLKRMIREGLSKIEVYDESKLNILFSDHHLSHAASTYFTSNFENSAILTVDGVGEWCTSTISVGRGNQIKVLKELNYPNSVGLLYSAFTYYLGFKVNSGEYKLMGLAPYGNSESDRVKQFENLIENEIVEIFDDGSIYLNQRYFDYTSGLKMTKNKQWEILFGFAIRNENQEILQIHCDLALAIQNVLERIIIKMAKEACKLTNSENICLAGGVALNCVSNSSLLNSGIFKNVHIQPASGDSGCSIGAALACYHIYYNYPRIIQNDIMLGTYLGPSFSNDEIFKFNKKYKAVSTKYDSFDILCDEIAAKISEGNVVGWFQGRMEFGPRALGNRSILADPSDAEMQKKLNLKIKFRESFRPFAPSVMLEYANDFFDMNIKSPHMMFVFKVKNTLRDRLPNGYSSLEFKGKMYVKRSKLQAITHLDYSARVQTVDQNSNPKFWNLLNKFKNKTGRGILVNTSFNVRGEPIVCSPYDAYRCFMTTNIDYLVMNDFIYYKSNQPQNLHNWSKEFEKD